MGEDIGFAGLSKCHMRWAHWRSWFARPDCAEFNPLPRNSFETTRCNAGMHGNLCARRLGTGITWTEFDNASDLSWDEAVDHCNNKPGNWGLPTPDELQAMYAPSLAVACERLFCNTSTKFKPSGPWFWSKQQQGPSTAWVVHLYYGNMDAHFFNFRFNGRALRVRRP